MTALVAGVSSTQDDADQRDRFRTDIQALRAVAVSLVVLYHIWPWLLPGGFVGVDVFFVISGFLITGHLISAARRDGRIRLAHFWARRAKRLLPASLLVLAVSAVATIALVPETLWRQFLREVTFATVYVLNWSLAADAVDYMAAENTPSPVQHFWSLSVEEQFYFFLPIVMVAVLWFTRRLDASWSTTRRTLIVFLAVITIASFVTSVGLTASSPQRAYFVTTTRAWEFGVGCLLAFAPVLPRWRALRTVLAWVGLTAIVASALLIDGGSPFPGWIAILPVLGTLLVITAHVERTAASPMRLGEWRPIQHLGALSYSLYLWHWPLIVLWPYAVGREITQIDRPIIVGVSIGCAWLSLTFVENPFRRHTERRWATPAVVLIGTTAGMMVVLAMVWGGHRLLDRAEHDAAALTSSVSEELADPCRGAPTMDPGSTCFARPVSGLSPTPLTASDSAVRPVCMTGLENSTLNVCESGAPAEEALATVAVIGDSHAGHWRAAVDQVAADRNWRVLTILKGSCPFTDATRATNDRAAENCRAWNSAVVDELHRRDDVSAVFVAASPLNGFRAADDEDAWAAGVSGYVRQWSALPESVEHVYVLRGVPRPRSDNLDCLQELGTIEEMTEAAACSRPASEAILPDPMVEAANRLPGEVTVVDLTHLFCDEADCLVVVGGIMVYRDAHHMTAAFAQTLAPYVARSLRPPAS